MRVKSICLLTSLSLFALCSFAARPGGKGVLPTGNVMSLNSEVTSTQGVNQANKIKVTGKVVDEKGEAIIGASIRERGTLNGTTSDLNGNFSLSVSAGSTISISFIGYVTKEVKAGRNLKVVLVEEAKSLDEVVVVGYGTQKKKLITGSTVQVKGDDIAKLNTVDPLGALQSQSPGVTITQSNGFLNSGFIVNIRGIGTIGNSSPLYVVDGVANASIEGLNPSDIESIDVLKDAASSAIYGARAANGVILVTTKHGREGTANVTYDGYVGWQNLYKIPNLLKAKEFMMMQDEGRVMDGLAPYTWSTYIPQRDLTAIDNGTWEGTNWLKEVENKDASIQNHALNFTGGTAMSTYAIGLAYTRQEATMGVPSSVPYMNRYNFRVNTDHVILRTNGHDLLKVGETINYKYTQINGSFATGGIYWNGMHNMLVMSPLMHAYNSNGDYYTYDDIKADGYNWDTSNGADKNPIAYLDYFMNQSKSKSHYMQSSFYAELQPIKNLKIKSQFGYIYGSSSYRSYVPTYNLTETLSTDTDQVTQSVSSYHRWTLDNTANYVFDYKKDHHFDILFGQSCEKWGFGDEVSGTKKGSNFTDFKHAYLSNVPTTATSVTSLSGYPTDEGALVSFFGRVNYDYKETYMASVVLRADGSSVFARGHRWGYFPSVSAGWVISNESFMKPTSSWLDFLKLRASWGQNGNKDVATFQYLALVTSNNGYGGYSFGDSMNMVSTGSYSYRLTNPDLKWETEEQLDLGFDARMLQSRLGVEFDWYTRLTKDWLVVDPIPYNIGANAPDVNGGNIRNTGVELGLNWNDKIGRDVKYGINYNISYNKNKVTKVGSDNHIIHGSGSILWEGSEECYRVAEVGQPVGYFYGYKSDGIFQNQAQIDNYQGAKLNGAKTEPGDVIWVDTNKDGVINTEDRTKLGDPHPDVTMGLSFNVSWKALDFAVTTYGAFGQQIMKCYRDFSASPLQNYTTDIMDRWHGEGTSNKYPKLSSASSNNWNQICDLYIENGDYLKIKNVTVGFDFKKLFTKLPCQQLRLYAMVQNLYTFTGYSGMDPEIGFGGEDAGSYAQGIDLGFYPSSRNFLIGVNVKF
jgi:TonB-linked SusC/RagA family outer membrane protein